MQFRVPIPKISLPPSEDLVPSTLLISSLIQKQVSQRLLYVLFDSGGTKTMMHKRCLPRGAVLRRIEESKAFNTVVGVLKMQQVAYLHDISLPEFDKTKRIDEQQAYIFDQNCKYDIILGRDFLRKAGIVLNFSDNTMNWLGTFLPMRPDRGFEEAMENYHVAEIIDEDDENELDEDLECYVTAPILEAKYDRVNVMEVIEKQTHLTRQQRKDLLGQLQKFNKLFDGSLGKYPHHKIHLELAPGARPVHSRPYPVARLHEKVFRKELQHLCEIGVLTKVGGTEWAAPMFIIPKKDGRIRWVSDFRALNCLIKRRPYPLPIIANVIRRRQGYRYFTKIDLSMQSHHSANFNTTIYQWASNAHLTMCKK